MANFYGPAFDNVTDNKITTVIHHFINAKGFDYVIPRTLDEEYYRMVDLMNQQEAHDGILESVIWETKDPNYEWTEEVYTNLSSLVIVKEQIKATDRFNKKITLRNQECALFDFIQGCLKSGQNYKAKYGAEALIAIKPDTRTIFQFETK